MGWTARDIAILRDIHVAGVMTKTELAEKYFPRTKQAVTGRMWALKRDGLVQAKTLKDREGSRNVVYSLTAKGMSLAIGEWREEKVEPESERRKRQRTWGERDLRFLHELFHIRELIRRQAIEVFYGGNEKYADKRLSVMKKENIIVSKVKWDEEQGARCARYRILEKGIRILEESGRIEETEIRARDLELTEKQREYILDANELHFAVPSVIYLDSRAIKRKHSMNRGNLVAGGFENDRGSFPIYMVQNDALEKTMLRLLNEIGEGQEQIAAYLVYTKGFEAKAAFERTFVQQKVVTGGIPVHVLPFNERGFEITRRLILGGELPKLLGQYGILAPTQGRYGFLYGMRCRDGTRKYVLEYLTGDRIVIDRSLREYKGVLQSGESQGVLLFCWEEDEAAMRERVKHIPYSIEVVSLSFKTAFEPSLPNP